MRADLVLYQLALGVALALGAKARHLRWTGSGGDLCFGQGRT